MQLSDNFNYEEKGQGILESVGVHDGRVNLKTFLSWLVVIDDSQAYASELDAWVQFIIEAAGEERAAQLEHAAVATCSEQFANLVRQKRTVMDGATAPQENLRALSLDQSIVQTAIPAALIVTAGKSHKGPKTVAGSRNGKGELNRTMEACDRRVANGDVVSDALIPEPKAVVAQVSSAGSMSSTTRRLMT